MSEGAKARVLVVDDDEPLLEVIQTILEPLDFEIRTINRASKALKVLADESFDLVISDLVMPDVDGHDLIEALRARGDQTAVLFLSGSGKVPDVVRLMKSGASSFLEKPFEPKMLKREVLAVLAEVRQRRAAAPPAEPPEPRDGLSLIAEGWTDSSPLAEVSVVELSVLGDEDAVREGTQLSAGAAPAPGPLRPPPAPSQPPKPTAARPGSAGAAPRAGLVGPSKPPPPPNALRRSTPPPLSPARSAHGIPKQLGRYRLLEVLASGGMGKVFRAHDPNLDRFVALKVILPPSSQSEREEFLTRFGREAVALAKLRHPHIVAVHDRGIDRATGIAYLVMELVEGRPLTELLDTEGSLSLGRALRFGEQLAEALAVAHQHGIVHRDVKPDNVIVDKTDGVRLIDFGVVRTEDSDVTMARILVGTPSYLSPEAAMGGVVDWRADQFSLATVLLQMLSGKRVFRGESVPRTVRNVREQNPPTLEELGMKSPPAGLQELLALMHAKDPDARIQDEQELLRRLRAVRAAVPAG